MGQVQNGSTWLFPTLFSQCQLDCSFCYWKVHCILHIWQIPTQLNFLLSLLLKELCLPSIWKVEIKPQLAGESNGSSSKILLVGDREMTSTVESYRLYFPLRQNRVFILGYEPWKDTTARTKQCRQFHWPLRWESVCPYWTCHFFALSYIWPPWVWLHYIIFIQCRWFYTNQLFQLVLNLRNSHLFQPWKKNWSCWIYWEIDWSPQWPSLSKEFLRVTLMRHCFLPCFLDWEFTRCK